MPSKVVSRCGTFAVLAKPLYFGASRLLRAWLELVASPLCCHRRLVWITAKRVVGFCLVRLVRLWNKYTASSFYSEIIIKSTIVMAASSAQCECCLFFNFSAILDFLDTQFHCWVFKSANKMICQKESDTQRRNFNVGQVKGIFKLSKLAWDLSDSCRPCIKIGGYKN